MSTLSTGTWYLHLHHHTIELRGRVAPNSAFRVPFQILGRCRVAFKVEPGHGRKGHLPSRFAVLRFTFPDIVPQDLHALLIVSMHVFGNNQASPQSGGNSSESFAKAQLNGHGFRYNAEPCVLITCFGSYDDSGAKLDDNALL